MRKRSSSDKIAKKPIFAVVIGINKYGSSSYTNLCGAAEDADRFNNYLTHNLGVQSDNIYNLRDENASRLEVIRSFRWLKGHPKIKKTEAVIIIYFAGHGDWTGKGTQMVCPSDIGVEMPSRNGRTKLVEGLSGRFLAKLFREVSRAKGDNITIFLDCCHSTGMLLPKAIIKRRITTQNGPSFLTSSAIFVEDRELYTVITACGSRRQAFEDGSMKAGLFTSRLLEVLNSHNAEYLTYISLMHQLLVGLPTMQIAHCEGSRLQRPLFNFDPAHADDPSLVLTRSLPDGSFLLYAGTAQGIVEGDKLFMHANNLSNHRINPPLGSLMVASAEEFLSVLRCDPILGSPHVLLSSFYCKLVGSSTGKNTVLYCSDKNWLKSIFSLDIQSRLCLSIADDREDYDLRLDILDNQVHFLQSPKLVTTFVDPCMREVINAEDIYKIRKVVERFIHFYSNLARNSSHNLGEIDIELHELVQQGKNGEDMVFIPSNTRILVDDQIQIAANDTKVYGLTVRNRSKVKLYPYLFCFDPTDLTIKELYQPPAAAGEYWSTNKTDSALLPSSELTIGYGSNVTRVHFRLPPGQRVAIAHLRLYLSSCPTSFESMIRETSPFADVREGSGVINSEDDSPLQDDRWMVKTMTFILG